MIATNSRVKITAPGDFKDKVGTMRGYSIAGEAIVELDHINKECVHFPEDQVEAIGPADGTQAVVSAGAGSAAVKS